MKKSILVALAALLLAPAAFAADTLIIRSQIVSGKPSVGPEISIGFTDSSFDYAANGSDVYKTSFCYAGDAYAVCSQVVDAASGIFDGYKNGAHDNMALKACGVSVEQHVGYTATIVKVQYQLSDDYGSSFLVDRNITECVKN